MTTANIVGTKIARIRAGAAPRLLDLFAGCGGISLGFERAGFRTTGAVELDPPAAQSHALNFYRNMPEDVIRRHSEARDILRVEPEELVRDLGGDNSHDDSFDIIVGGPPCQAFARVGRAKLREVAAHPQAFKLDPRSNLYLRYLQYVKQLRPLVIVMENVPDVLNFGGHNIAEEIAETLEEAGYRCLYTLLNAVHYGVPQMRERMFLIGLADELNAEPTFPAPTHHFLLPRGYEGTRAVALKNIKLDLDLFEQDHFYVSPPSARKDLPPAVTAREALCDLPPMTEHLAGRMPRGARRFDSLSRYRRGPISLFAEEMRTWPGFEAGEGVFDHVIRSLPRDYDIFRRMRPGDQYPEAHEHALELFAQALRKEERAGRAAKKGSKAYTRLRASIVPPYDPTKFPNKWRKMEADKPSRTLMAHLGKDGYSHIHYDSEQARTISVREAARLQSFPDGFVFSGTMNPAFRQIGNAVPPLLAYRVALSICSALGIGNVTEIRTETAHAIRSDTIRVAVS